MSERSFTIESVTDVRGNPKGKANLGGRFISATPSAAGRKAMSRVCRESKIKGQCTLMITIRETTRGSDKKTFQYKGKRMLQPTTVTRGGEEIEYRYITKVSKA
jgi:hypothetical protein